MPCLVQLQQVVDMARQFGQAAPGKPLVMLDEALQSRIVHQSGRFLLALLLRQFSFLLAAPVKNAVKGRRPCRKGAGKTHGGYCSPVCAKLLADLRLVPAH